MGSQAKLRIQNKANNRSGGLANIVQQQAASLSDTDINELADYYRKLK